MEQQHETTEWLRPVEEDHEILLGEMHALEGAIELLRKDDEDETHAMSVLEQLHRYFLHELLPHLAREEREFLPAVRRRLASGAAMAMRVEDEHAELRRRIEEFKTAFTIIRYVGPQTRQSLLWRLVTEARAIFARLKTHAAYETQLQRELMNHATASPGPRTPPGTAPAA